MNKLLNRTIILFLLSIFLLTVTHGVIGQTEISVDVMSAGTPQITNTAEFVQGTENEISWTTADLAAEYYAEVATDAGFGTIIDNSGWTSGLSYDFVSLDDDTKYYYRVKARNTEGGEGYWSDTYFATQDDNAPSSRVLDLAEEKTTASFVLKFDYYDETSVVDTITLFYRKDGGSWVSHSTFSPVSEITFNSLTTGGDGEYEFFTVAVDIVGNTESEPAHVDATTVVDTSGPPLEPEPEPGPTPAPIPTPPPTPGPALMRFIYITYVGGVYVREVNSVDITINSPTVSGRANAQKRVHWELKTDSGNMIDSGFTQSSDGGYWEVNLQNLEYGTYNFRVYTSYTTGSYEDEIQINIVHPEEVLLELYAFPKATITAYLDSRLIEIGVADDVGKFNGKLAVPSSFRGAIVFRAELDEEVSEVVAVYSGERSLGALIFPPILLPAFQDIGLNQMAGIYGFATVGARVSIYVDSVFVEEVEVDEDGKFSYTTEVFSKEGSHNVRANQIINGLESLLSSVSVVRVSRAHVPTEYRIGDIVARNLGNIAIVAEALLNAALLAVIPLTLFAAVLFYLATTPTGFYSLLQLLKSLIGIFPNRRKHHVQIIGVDSGNLKGVLNIYDRSSDKLIESASVNAEGESWIKKQTGYFLAEFVHTGCNGVLHIFLNRNRKLYAYYSDKFIIKKNQRESVVQCLVKEELSAYPFEIFERWFDRLIMFVNMPLSVVMVISAIVHFYVFGNAYGLVSSVLGVICFGINIVLALYHRARAMIDVAGRFQDV